MIQRLRTNLNSRGYASLQYKKNVPYRMVHGVYSCTSRWVNFDKALENNRKQGIENQHQEKWSDRVVFETLKIIFEKTKVSRLWHQKREMTAD